MTPPRPRRARPRIPAAVVVVLVAVLAMAAACSSPGRSGAAGDGSGPGSLPATTTPAGRPSAGCTVTGEAGTATTGPLASTLSEQRSVTVGGVERSYLLSRPPDAGPADATPVLLAFHGFGSDAEAFTALTDVAARGTAAGFTVIVPDGAAHTWQTSGTGTDAAFVDALVDQVASSSCVDLDRVSASGFSAGAAFTIAYACNHPDRVAAIITVAVEFQLGCTRPLPLLAFHGTADPAVPYADGAVGLSLPGVKVRGTERNLGDWAALDGCGPTPTVEAVGPEVDRLTFGGCRSGTEVVAYRVNGGGHTWPGADPAKGAGLTTQEISATDLALAFAARHARH